MYVPAYPGGLGNLEIQARRGMETPQHLGDMPMHRLLRYPQALPHAGLATHQRRGLLELQHGVRYGWWRTPVGRALWPERQSTRVRAVYSYNCVLYNVITNVEIRSFLCVDIYVQRHYFL